MNMYMPYVLENVRYVDSVVNKNKEGEVPLKYRIRLRLFLLD